MLYVISLHSQLAFTIGFGCRALDDNVLSSTIPDNLFSSQIKWTFFGYISPEPASLSEQSFLVKLSLDSNQISGYITQALLSTNNALGIINLDSNHLSGSIFQPSQPRLGFCYDSQWNVTGSCTDRSKFALELKCNYFKLPSFQEWTCDMACLCRSVGLTRLYVQKTNWVGQSRLWIFIQICTDCVCELDLRIFRLEINRPCWFLVSG